MNQTLKTVLWCISSGLITVLIIVGVVWLNIELAPKKVQQHSLTEYSCEDILLGIGEEKKIIHTDYDKEGYYSWYPQDQLMRYYITACMDVILTDKKDNTLTMEKDK